jgi:hypothetical protein
VDLHIGEIPYGLVTAFALTGAAIGLWRGGRDGAVVAVVILAQAALGWAFDWPPLRGTLVDVATLAVCLTLVLRGRSYWTIWAAASGLLSVLTQLFWIVPGISLWAFYSAQQAWYLVLIGTLIVGSLLAPRATRS